MRSIRTISFGLARPLDVEVARFRGPVVVVPGGLEVVEDGHLPIDLEPDVRPLLMLGTIPKDPLKKVPC